MVKTKFLFFSIIFFSSFLTACSQQNTRKDIEEKLQGTWVGTAKDFQFRDANELSILFEKDNIRFRNNYHIDEKNHREPIPDMDRKYRVFIHSNGDTIIEQRYNMMESIIKEPIYGKLHVVNGNEIRVFFLFKLNSQIYLGLSLEKDGWYLKRSLNKE